MEENFWKEHKQCLEKQPLEKTGPFQRRPEREALEGPIPATWSRNKGLIGVGWASFSFKH